MYDASLISECSLLENSLTAMCYSTPTVFQSICTSFTAKGKWCVVLLDTQ